MAEAEKTNGVGAKIGSIIGTIALAGACGAAGWIARGMMPQGGPKGPGMMAPPPASVAVMPARLHPYNLPERYVAHAEAVQEVDLLPQVDGYVKEIKFKEGDTVKEGQLLYLLDDERYQAVVNQRKADLEAAEAECRRAQRYWDRMQKADARGITQTERDDAEAAAEKAKAAVQQAKADLVVAEYDCKKARVIAPISGQIGKTTAHVGDYVAPSKGALAHIMQIDPIRVTFPLTDRAYVGWREAQKKGGNDGYRMRLLLPDGSEFKGEGKWDFDDNQMSKETATIIMRLSFPNPDRLLVPNSYLTLLADQKNPAPVLCVPQQAVVDLAGGNQGVYVLNEADMTVEQRIVKTRETFAGWTPISNVKEGEKIVISGVSKLHQGSKVVLAEATSNDDIDPKYEPPIKE